MISTYDNWLANATVVGATLLVIAAVVVLHYEGLILLTRGIRRASGRQRTKVLYVIFSVLTLHVVEIWLFGIMMWLTLLWPACGYIAQGTIQHSTGLLDTIYFSAVTYTTVGFGDVVPVGPVRFIVGTEALTGFVLIGWSASFIYLEMERFWRNP